MASPSAAVFSYPNSYPKTPLLPAMALLVAATKSPTRVPGSDGNAHRQSEYDLVVTSAFPGPVALTAVEALVPCRDTLLPPAGEVLVAATQTLFGSSLVPSSPRLDM